MNAVVKITSFQMRDLLRSRWALFYTLFFFLLTDGLFRFSPDQERVTLSLINVTLFVVPLVSMLFGSMFYYNSREYIEMILAQPINRRTLFAGMYFGLSLSLSLAFCIGAIVPFIIHGYNVQAFLPTLLTLMFTGIALTMVFVGLAFWVAITTDDKGKGLGTTILYWLWFAVIYDGLILLGSFVFYKYPLEKVIIALTMFNPTDLSRILLLMQMDVAALMGYTGAVIERFFGSMQGQLICWSAISLWIIAPFALGMRSFTRKDL
ncbi:ABC transporter permease subunit [Gemmatimonas aurantiaca]|nr:ABC transporter permease subunit [Gemmatimonas aurantiaca]